MINKSIKLADFLDANGAVEEAEEVDSIIRSLAEKEVFHKEVRIQEDNGDEKATVSYNHTDKDGKTTSKTKDYTDVEDALKDFESLQDEEEMKLDDDMVAHLMDQAEKEESKSAKAHAIDKLISLADKLDAAGDFKKAHVIDQFLKSAAEKDSNPYDYSVSWREENPKSEQSKRYDSDHHHSLQIKEPTKKQERFKQKQYDVPSVSTYKATNHALSTRHCPDHIGVPIKRVGEGIYQCMLDGAIYNYEVGFTDQNGVKVPGGSIAAQTPNASEYAVPSRLFDSREPVVNNIN